MVSQANNILVELDTIWIVYFVDAMLVIVDNWLMIEQYKMLINTSGMRQLNVTILG